jgi:hypothetical protein
LINPALGVTKLSTWNLAVFTSDTFIYYGAADLSKLELKE